MAQCVRGQLYRQDAYLWNANASHGLTTVIRCVLDVVLQLMGPHLHVNTAWRLRRLHRIEML